MENNNYSTEFKLPIEPLEASSAINAVDKWWSENISGSTLQAGDHFTVTFGETFVDFEVTRQEPGKLTEWLVTNSNLHWQQETTEWNNTRVKFELEPEGNATRVKFTHIGLTPEITCYEGCSKGWNQYFGDSLYKLMLTGKGEAQQKQPA